MKKFLALIVVLVYSCNVEKDPSTEKAIQKLQDSIEKAIDNAIYPQVWTYANDTDKMDNTIKEMAYVYAKEEEYHPSLVVSKDKDGIRAYFMVEGAIFGDGMWRIKYDEEKPHDLEMHDSESGKSLFIAHPKKFIEKIRGAKKIIFETHLYSHGKQQWTFNVERLKIE